MRAYKAENVFIAVVFIVIYAILAENASLTGLSIGFNPGTPAQTQPGKDFPAATTYYLILDDEFNAAMPLLSNTNTIMLIKGLDTFKITILRVHQDLELRLEKVDLLLEPGNKWVSLHEGDEQALDFNNDNQADAIIKIDSIAYGMAYLTLYKP
jgi:hypothetical protein